MFQFIETPIPGAFGITMPHFEDGRGAFTKVFQEAPWHKEGIDFKMKESYYSLSEKGVIRGMHFQRPPFQHHKIVYCPQGALLDVVLDLRKGSPSYGQHFSTILSSENHQGIFIPEGCAHGFKSLESKTLTAYLVSSEYHRDSDTGILWNSFGMDWACPHPVVSERDQSFPPLSDFDSPF